MITSLNKYITKYTTNSLEEIATALGGSKVFKNSNGFMTCCPAHNDNNPSLSISLRHDGKLLAHCFAGCSFTDVINAIQSLGLLTRNKIMRHKLSNVNSASVSRVNKINSSSIEYINKLWKQAEPGSNSLVESYLRARSLTIAVPSSIGFLPHHYHRESKTYWPCMISAVNRWPSDEVIAVHRTFLSVNGCGKAPVTPNKKMLGQVAGGAVRFGECLEVIALAEGIETALSYWQETGVTTWAVLSASGFSNIVLPPVDITKEVIILADHDESGVKAAKLASKRFVQEGRKVYLNAPQEKGQDFNDLLRGMK
jgi:hypothetical protein